MALLVLVGLPGSGKTTAGRTVASVLSRAFVDTDALFDEREGESVQAYLRRCDEETFREREYVVLEHALVSDGVVSTGGGIVTTEAARNLLRRELTVWLDSPDEILAERVREGDRPLLGDDPVTRIRDLRQSRDGLYRDVSRFRVDSSQPLDRVVSELTDIVSAAQASS